MRFIFIHTNFTHMFQLLQHQATTESVGTNLCHHNLSKLLKRQKNSTAWIFTNIFNRNRPPTLVSMQQAFTQCKYARFGEYAKLVATLTPIKYFLNTSTAVCAVVFKTINYTHTHTALPDRLSLRECLQACFLPL